MVRHGVLTLHPSERVAGFEEVELSLVPDEAQLIGFGIADV